MPPEEKSNAAYCPNCQKPATRDGNEITCDRCDAIFTITKKDGAKVKKLGPLQDHEERISKIEASVFAEEPEPEPTEPQGGEDDDEPDSENDDTDQDQEVVDGDILPR